MTAKVVRSGALMDKPRWVRILAITVGSSMAAMIFKGPPHWGYCSLLIANTRMPPGPADAGRRRVMGRIAVIVCGVIGVDRPARKARARDWPCLARRGRSDLWMQSSVGREHAMGANAAGVGTRNAPASVHSSLVTVCGSEESGKPPPHLRSTMRSRHSRAGSGRSPSRHRDRPGTIPRSRCLPADRAVPAGALYSALRSAPRSSR
jgi:hypothetical protein